MCMCACGISNTGNIARPNVKMGRPAKQKKEKIRIIKHYPVENCKIIYKHAKNINATS